LQVLYHTPARVQGSWSAAHHAYVLRPDQLPFWADSDWDLGGGTPATQGACSGGGGGGGALTGADDSSALIATQLLHWVVFVPPPAQRPLLVLQPDGQPSPSNSMWVPSWGGIIVVNPPSSGGSSQQEGGPGDGRQQQQQQQQLLGAPGGVQLLDSATLSKVAGTFVSQLHALMGLPTDTAFLAPGTQPGQAGAGAPALHLPAASSGLASWQLDALVRQRTVADLSVACKTLGSLANIAQQLPNLEMPDLIGQQVQQAMTALGQAAALVRGGDYQAASHSAQLARSNADAAFLHPAVLAQNNFPDSHKLGIYMPLFLPVSVPLVQGLLLELARLARKRGLLRGRGAVAAAQ
jgi:phosphatidylinositol glycan class S